MATEKVSSKRNKSEEKDSSPKSVKSEHRKSKTNKICKGVIINIIKSIFFLFRLYLDKFIDYCFTLYWDEQRKTIPDLEARHSILKESAVSLAEKIRNKELKSVDLVTACVERIKQVNPVLNAVTDERYEAALEEAKEVDEIVEKGLSVKEFKKKPFLGVPFTAKESHAVKGMLHTLGIKSRRNERAEYDAECVRLLRAAGAIPVAVTNVPEINKWQETRNMVFGQTNNPYHTCRTTGGSSGGEAALSAAIASPISLCPTIVSTAFGGLSQGVDVNATTFRLTIVGPSDYILRSDIGGSTRMPAFFCGLFGLNPTAGHTSLKGSALRTGLDPTIASIGFLSKHCEDLLPLIKIVAGDQAHLLNLDRDVYVKDLKFFYVDSVKDMRISPINSDMKRAMNKIVSLLSQQAVSTDKVPKPYYHRGFNHCFSLWRHAMTKETENFAMMLANNQGEVNGLMELGKKLVGSSDFTLAAIMKLLDDQVLPTVNVEWAEDLTEALREDLIQTLGTDGVLLFPSAPSAAPYHCAAYFRPFNFALWGIFNALKFPAVQVPLGLNYEGLPVGIQVVATPRQEALCAAVAKHLEAHCGGYVPPCKLLQ